MTERNLSWELRGGAVWVLALVAASLCLRATPVHACGGFFCSQTAPVEQAAEEIIFADNADGTVTAVIRIQYAGPSEQFAWVLPIPGAPDEVGVSSNVAFDNLRVFSDPQYVLTTSVEGMCRNDGFFGFPGAMGAAGTGSALPPTAENDGVGVVAQGSVGPYDWTVIDVDEQLADPADSAVNWLVDNGYDVTDLGPDVLRPYIESGLNLMAFRLTKGADANTGSIRPVVLTYESEVPAIPIRPTAVAAQNDMGILVWVLGDSQAIPSNYKSLVVNEARINWFNYRQNYRAVVTEAADEAGGQGFVTEMAGSTGQLAMSVFPAYQEQQWREYSLTTFVDGYDAIQQAQWRFGGWDGWRDAVCGAVTLPPNVTCDDFGRNPDTYRGSVQIDEDAFILTLYEDVVRPVIKTQELLLSRPYFTRLFSTMSADEMTVDPAFDFNADLADVSNLHMAEQVIECSPDVSQFEAPWRISLPQGGTIRGKGQQGLWPVELGDLPANQKIVQLGTRGPGEVVQDNTADIIDALREQGGSAGSTGNDDDPPPSTTGGRGGVMIGGGGTGGSGQEEEPPATTAGRGGVPIEGPGATNADEGGGDGLCSVARVQAGADARGAWLLVIAGALLGVRSRRRRAAR